MATVHLRHPLRDLADDHSEVELKGADLRTILLELERRFPRMSGWVLDDTGALRRHVAVFVHGEKSGLDTTVSDDDEVHIIQAISGGADAELVVGTRKGLFVLRGQRGGNMEIAGRAFAGQDVEFAMKDQRSGMYFASVTHGQFGPRLYLTLDPTGEWEQTEGPTFPEDAGDTVERIWVIKKGEADGEMWAGIAPRRCSRARTGAVPGVSYGASGTTPPVPIGALDSAAKPFIRYAPTPVIPRRSPSGYRRRGSGSPRTVASLGSAAVEA